MLSLKKQIEREKLNLLLHFSHDFLGFPQWLSSKESTCNAGDSGSIPGSGRSPEGGNSNSLHYSCPENPMDRGAWWATVQRITKSQTRLNTEQHFMIF